jgi:anti-anti-sigma factor
MSVMIMSQELFHVVRESSVNVIGLTVPDGLDSIQVDSLIENILQSITPEAKGRWVADLSQVSYMGSSLLGLMVNIRERIRTSGGRLVVCGVGPGLKRIFESCCLDRLFVFAPSRNAAIANLKG